MPSFEGSGTQKMGSLSLGYSAAGQDLWPTCIIWDLLFNRNSLSSPSLRPPLGPLSGPRSAGWPRGTYSEASRLREQKRFNPHPESGDLILTSALLQSEDWMWRIARDSLGAITFHMTNTDSEKLRERFCHQANFHGYWKYACVEYLTNFISSIKGGGQILLCGFCP